MATQDRAFRLVPYRDTAGRIATHDDLMKSLLGMR